MTPSERFAMIRFSSSHLRASRLCSVDSVAAHDRWWVLSDALRRRHIGQRAAVVRTQQRSTLCHPLRFHHERFIDEALASALLLHRALASACRRESAVSAARLSPPFRSLTTDATLFAITAFHRLSLPLRSLTFCCCDRRPAVHQGQGDGPSRDGGGDELAAADDLDGVSGERAGLQRAAEGVAAVVGEAMAAFGLQNTQSAMGCAVAALAVVVVVVVVVVIHRRRRSCRVRCCPWCRCRCRRCCSVASSVD